jgi:prepilin-type N-terminal cleavage/methylation domain-containing protein
MRRAGFTILELLMAMTLLALVLVGLNTFLFSMSELWGRNSDVRLFDQHVRNVTRFLRHELENAALPPAGRAGQSAITTKEIRPRNGATEQMLTFELPKGSRLLTWPDRPLPDVECSLIVREREGLILLWHSRLEKRFDDDPPRETVITPLATALSYDYYDSDFKRWRTEQTLLRDSTSRALPPQRLRLKFTYRGLTRETLVVVPHTAEGMPQL